MLFADRAGVNTTIVASIELAAKCNRETSLSGIQYQYAVGTGPALDLTVTPVRLHLYASSLLSVRSNRTFPAEENCKSKSDDALPGITTRTNCVAYRGMASSAPQFRPDPNAEKTSGPARAPVSPRCHSSAAISKDADEVFP